MEDYVVTLGGKRLIKRFRRLLLLPIDKLPANSLAASQTATGSAFDSDKIARLLRASLDKRADEI